MTIGIPKLDAIDPVEITWNFSAGFWEGSSVLRGIQVMGVFTYGERAGRTLLERGNSFFLNVDGGLGISSYG